MSSTTTAASSATTTSSEGGSGTFLNSGGSTLILAFLAIGLFVGGLLVMFSMRRYVSINRRRMRAWQASGERSLGRDAAAQLADTNSPSRRHRNFGQKPELCDVRVAAASRTTWAGDWERATPIAARALYAGPRTSSARDPNTTASSSTSSPLSSTYLHPFVVGLRDTRAQLAGMRVPWARHASNNAGASSQRLADGTPRPSGMAERGAARVEIAVTIALPTQTPCTPGRVPLFALGVTNVRWGGGSLTQEGATGSQPP